MSILHTIQSECNMKVIANYDILPCDEWATKINSNFDLKFYHAFEFASSIINEYKEQNKYSRPHTYTHNEPLNTRSITIAKRI